MLIGMRGEARGMRDWGMQELFASRLLWWASYGLVRTGYDDMGQSG